MVSVPHYTHRYAGEGASGRDVLPGGIALGVSFGWHSRFGCHEVARRGRHALPGGMLWAWSGLFLPVDTAWMVDQIHGITRHWDTST